MTWRMRSSRHTFSTHRYRVADTDSVVLPAYHAGFLNGGFDVLAQPKEMIVA